MLPALNLAGGHATLVVSNTANFELADVQST
jgi:hypothetical protein